MNPAIESYLLAQRAPLLPPIESVKLTVNGTGTELQIAPWTTLLDALLGCAGRDPEPRSMRKDHNLIGWGTATMPATIASAVFHATGKRVGNLPITLDKLL